MGSFRLDSDGSPTAPRWPMAACGANQIVRSNANGTVLLDRDLEIRRWDDPLAALAWLADTARSEIPPIRWVGYLSYDLGRLFEELPLRAADDLALPLFCFARCEPNVVRRPRIFMRSSAGSSRSTFTRDAYLAAVQRCIEYIRAGDVFQVNLSQRFTTPLPDDPALIAERLQTAAPARYGAYLDFGDHVLISNSPELFLRIDPDRTVTTRPIKGTRPRAAGMEQALLDSSKDQAELNMIVDLERNDLGRVCETGSVNVVEPRSIETHPTVYHGAATIQGKLRREVTFVDLLRATFPGGSVTGAPKIRAMEIIEELEPVRRGPYCGAIGYLASDGRIEFNIAIRTMIVQDRRVDFSVGGGIVADSEPVAEYDETLTKAAALFSALGRSSPQEVTDGS